MKKKKDNLVLSEAAALIYPLNQVKPRFDIYRLPISFGRKVAAKSNLPIYCWWECVLAGFGILA